MNVGRLLAWCLFMVLAQLPVLNANLLSASEIDVLFLGDQGHHQPLPRFKQLRAALEPRGIRLTYTEDINQLNSKTLENYAAIVLYANIDAIAETPAKALLEYVEQGGGFVPLHCASYCFRNNEDVVNLIGAQFQRHGTGVFRTKTAEPTHPIMQGFEGFESWDETYVHHKHNELNRVVLEVREDEEGSEPWTWVKTYGDGRVFYTAWGHDQRTWGNPGFQNLVERGIRWAAKSSLDSVAGYHEDRSFPIPAMKPLPSDEGVFAYEDVGAKIPNYRPGAQWGTQDEPLSLMQLPLAPEASLDRYSVPEGFRLELFASEPDLGGKPIAMTWDERGRLWVAETLDYPNELKPPGEGRDRIRICEDTDNDGRADRFTVFAEGLSIPTSIVFAHGNVIVQNGTETLRLRDTDGDDVADEREVMFDGWALGDTHGGVSNFQYGLDNWIWAMQGYNNSRPRVEGQETQSFRMGFFRFRPDGSELEFIRSTDNNTWGLGISEEGLIFGSTANHNPSVHMPIPNRYYERVRGWSPSVLRMISDSYLFEPITEKIRQVDQHGGYTAGAGHSLYTARSYPKEYWNRAAFVNGPTGHLVGTFVLSPAGSGFKSSSPFNLLASDDEWSAPIMAEVGPDGSVWVLDWYNYIVQHNPTPRGFETGKGNAYETDLRDKRHGRIYRVVYENGTPSPTPDLTQLEPSQWVEQLRNPNFLWRKHAQRLLVERGNDDVVPQLVEMLEQSRLDEIGLDAGAIHALWTLHGLGAIEPSKELVWQAMSSAMKHPSIGVRLNAVQVLPTNTLSTKLILDHGTIMDRSPVVRKAALLALADQEVSSDAGVAIAKALASEANLNDRWISEAATAAAAAHAPAFFAACNKETGVTPALENATRIVAEHWARSAVDAKNSALYAQSMNEILKSFPRMPDVIVRATLEGLVAGWPSEKTLALDEDTESLLIESMTGFPPSTRGQIVKLATRWGSDRFDQFASEIANSLLQGVAADETVVAERIRNAEELIQFRPKDIDMIGKLLDLITPQTDPALATGLIRAIRNAEAEGVGKLLVERAPELAPEQRKVGIAVLMRRPTWTSSLVTAMGERVIQLDELTLEQQRDLAEHPNESIAKLAKEILMRGGGLPSPDRQKVIESYVAATTESGDIAKGQELFKQHCANCHKYRDLGNKVGPDLTGMAVHPKEELLVHILDPNASVEGNFRVYTVETIDGLTLSGLLASETKTTIELFDSKGEKQTVLREDIDYLRASQSSLMPVGFEKQFDVGQMADLLAFLTQRGKYTPVDISGVATTSSARGMFYNRDATQERLLFPKWGIVDFKDIPFFVTDPQDGRVANCILLEGPIGPISAKMPKTVELTAAGPAKAIHLLGGVGGWAHPFGEQGSTSMIIKLHYQDGETEEHALKNGVHIADYIRRVDVAESEFAFQLRGQQLRYLAIYPKRSVDLARIEFVKGSDQTAPLVMAVTIESP